MDSGCRQRSPANVRISHRDFLGDRTIQELKSGKQVDQGAHFKKEEVNA